MSIPISINPSHTVPLASTVVFTTFPARDLAEDEWRQGLRSLSCLIEKLTLTALEPSSSETQLTESRVRILRAAMAVISIHLSPQHSELRAIEMYVRDQAQRPLVIAVRKNAGINIPITMSNGDQVIEFDRLEEIFDPICARINVFRGRARGPRAFGSKWVAPAGAPMKMAQQVA